MEFIDTEIQGVKLVKNNLFVDNRGSFLKLYNDEIFKKNGIDFKVKESYYSTSNKDVIRGMHFQLPPFDHDKLVNVINGKIQDIILDLRLNSKTYKKYISIELSSENNYSLFIPKGCAHGFRSLEDNTLVMYSVSTIYNSSADTGVRYDSFGVDWGINNPIVSDRDNSFEPLDRIKYIFK